MSYSSGAIAIRAEGLTKAYRLYEKPIDRLKESLHPFRRKYHRDFYALNGVSFEVPKGETCAIIGKNGSGKSTLLKIITGVLTPTSGKVEVSGRVSALLELGTGFNPELTGIENIYFSGTIMGYSREEVDGRVDSILSFADIGDFANQPVKTFSSGMFVRLAFAVATNIDPEILIVDEALAVGDMFFQAKCITRMKRMMDNGVTVLFVSHDMGTVKSLCRRAILLKNGNIVGTGPASEISEVYIRDAYLKSNETLKSEARQKETGNGAGASSALDNGTEGGFEVLVSKTPVDLGGQAHRFGSGEAAVLDLKVLNARHEEINIIDFRSEFYIQASILFKKSVGRPCIGYQIRDSKGIEIIGTTTVVERVALPPAREGDVFVLEFKTPNILSAGVYSVSFGAEEMIEENYRHIILEGVDNASVFEITNPESNGEKFWTKVHVPVETRFVKTAQAESLNG